MTRNLFLTRLQEEVLVYVSIVGMLERNGWLKTVMPNERLNVENADFLFECYREYIKVGADIITTNTLGANRAQLQRFGLENQLREMNLRGIEIARKAAGGRVLVAGEIGPTGILLENVSFEKILDVYREQIVALNEGRPDLLLISNISEIREMKAALIAWRELFHGPVISEMTLENPEPASSARSVAAILTILAPFQPDVVGVACAKFSDLLFLPEKMVKFSQQRFLVTMQNPVPERPGFSLEEMGNCALSMAKQGASVIGFRNVSPEHIREIALRLKHRKPVQWQKKTSGNLANPRQVLPVGPEKSTVFISNWFNSTTNLVMRQLLQAGKHSEIVAQARQFLRFGPQIFQLCVDAPGIDKIQAMCDCVAELEKLESLFLCLYSEKPAVLEAGLQRISGKALVSQPADDDLQLSLVLPLVKKYGSGIIISPGRADGQHAVALEVFKRRLAICRDYGIGTEDVWADCSFQTEPNTSVLFQRIQFIQEIKNRFAIKTVFSFHRKCISKTLKSTFLSMALANGLDVPIVNPADLALVKTIFAAGLILGRNRTTREVI